MIDIGCVNHKASKIADDNWLHGKILSVASEWITMLRESRLCVSWVSRSRSLISQRICRL